MSFLKRFRQRVREHQIGGELQEGLDENWESWTRVKFNKRLKQADSPREVRALWLQHARYSGKKCVEILGPQGAGVESVAQYSAAWDRRLAEQVIEALDRKNFWPYGDDMAANPALTPEAGAVLAERVGQVLFQRPSVERQWLFRIILALAERGFVPENHWLRERLLEEIKHDYQHPIIREIVLSLGDISVDQVQKLLEDQLDTIDILPTPSPQKQQDYPEYRAVEQYLTYLCHNVAPRDVPQWWKKLRQFHLESALAVLEELSNKQRQYINPDHIAPLLEHGKREVRQKTIILMGKLSSTPRQKHQRIGDDRPAPQSADAVPPETQRQGEHSLL